MIYLLFKQQDHRSISRTNLTFNKNNTENTNEEEMRRLQLNKILNKQPATDNEPIEENNLNEEELNSNDDVTEDDDIFENGRNLLMGYFEKYTRKKDRRKIILKHCILRVNELEFIIPMAKGEFDWVTKKNHT